MWPDVSHVKMNIPIVACVATFQREWATWARPYGPSECDGIIWYLAVIHIAAHVVIQGSPSIHNSAHVVIAFSCQFIAAVAHVAKQETRAVPYTRCSPGGNPRCSCKY